MLLYHPALDPYHCALRMLGLFSDAALESIEWERLRILDFLIAFPHKIKDIHLPRKFANKRTALQRVQGSYESVPNATRVFFQIEEIQSAALRLLGSGNLTEKESLASGTVRVVVPPMTTAEAIGAAVDQLPYRAEDWYAFIVECLVPYPLNGNGGLKARTGLLEYRHDYA